MKKRIIKDYLNLIEYENSSYLIDGKQLMTEEDKYEDEFIDVLNEMEFKGFIKTLKSASKKVPDVKLIPKGAFYGKEYIRGYDKIFEKVTSLIAKDSEQFDNDAEISEELNTLLLYVGAVLYDLENKKYIKLEQKASGIFFKFTERGNDYFLEIKQWIELFKAIPIDKKINFGE